MRHRTKKFLRPIQRPERGNLVCFTIENVLLIRQMVEERTDSLRTTPSMRKKANKITRCVISVLKFWKLFSRKKKGAV